MVDQLIVSLRKTFPEGGTAEAEFSCGNHVLVLFGPSGAGKTTVLKCIAGLERPSAGSIQFENEIWFDSATQKHLAPQKRSIGYLPQHYALFPHLTVQENIAYGIPRKSERKNRMEEMLRLFQLADLQHRFPAQLSGGQQQRVALARALARKPALLLLDEPLSALDTEIRQQLRDELRTLLQSQNIPAICVTHDWTEALTLADRIAVLSRGKLQQVGLPDEIFTRPINAEVASIAGIETVVIGKLLSSQNGLISLRIGSVTLSALQPAVTTQEFYVCIRSENVAIEIASAGSTSIRNHLSGTVQQLKREGSVYKILLDCGFPLTALLTGQAVQDLGLEPGKKVIAGIKASAIHLIPKR